MVNHMDLENYSGPMVVRIQANFTRVLFMVLEKWKFLYRVCMRANGKMVSKMDMEL